MTYLKIGQIGGYVPLSYGSILEIVPNGTGTDAVVKFIYIYIAHLKHLLSEQKLLTQ